MADERELNYRVNFGADKAADDIEKLKGELDGVVDNLDEAESKSKGFTSALDRAGKIGGGAVDGVGKSLEKNFGGAVDRANKRSTVFIKNLVTGAKNIGNAFLHPIQTIRKHLVDAVDEAEDETHGLESKAEETGRSLDKMGSAGKNAGDAIKRSISAGLKAFLGIEAIKKATQLIKDFVTTSLDAAQAAEGAGARFSALFENTDAAAWAENYAEATKTAISNVQTWMSDNKAFLDYLGYSQQEAANLSKIVTGLGDDIAEAFHVDESSVMSALQDALGGDFKALHSIGVKIDEDQLKETAKRFYEELGDKNFKKDLDKLTEAQYASVALASILESTSNLQGKSIEEASTLAGATENLKQTWESALEKIGEALSPAFIEIINRLSDAIVEHSPAIVRAAESVGNALIAMAPKVEAIANWLSQWIVAKTEESGNEERVNAYMETGQLPEMTPEESESYNSYIAEQERKMNKFDQSWLGRFKNWINDGYDYTSRLSAVPGDGSSGGIDKELWQRHSEDTWLVNTWDKVTNALDWLTGKEKEDTRQPQAPKEEAQHGAIYNGLNDFSNWYLDKAFTLRGWIDNAGSSLWNWVSRSEQSAVDTSNSLDSVGASADVVNGRMETLTERIDILNKALSTVGQPEYTLPNNARGTNNFPGGWTRMNEEGGELAFLPQGTAIVPADKTNQIINTSRTSSPVFAPVIQIEIGSADQNTAGEIERRLEAMVRRLYTEMQNDEFTRLSVQNAYARG